MGEEKGERGRREGERSMGLQVARVAQTLAVAEQESWASVVAIAPLPMPRHLQISQAEAEINKKLPR